MDRLWREVAPSTHPARRAARHAPTPPSSVLLLMARLLVPVVLLVPALAAATVARGSKPSDDGPWLKALSDQFVVTDMAAGDVDGDGAEDAAVCYQVAADNPDAGGGIAILQRRRGALRPGYHVRLDRAWCDKVKIANQKVGLLLKSHLTRAKAKQLVWSYGKDFAFPGDEGHPLTGVTITASSSLKDDVVRAPEAAIDGDLLTSWAEAASGTGIGETLTLRFEEPVDIGYVALFPGSAAGRRAFFDHNRLHRGSFETRTKEDLGDEVAGIDFSELGIDVGGDRIEFSLENRPEVRYVAVGKQRVAQLELRIDSVFLGDKRDDTHIAEIEIVPTLKLTETLDRAEPLRAAKAAPTKAAARSGEEKPGSRPAPAREDEATKDGEAEAKPRSRGDKAVDELDASGSAFVPDDF